MILNSYLAKALIESIPTDSELRAICVLIKDPDLKDKMLDLKIELTIFRRMFDLEKEKNEEENLY